MVRHLVRKTDTLVGLSLRYGVKVDDIKQANKLNTNHSVFAYKYLLIPNPARVPPPEESEESLPKDGKQSIGPSPLCPSLGWSADEFLQP